ncbi:MAG: amidohydrolase family protein [Phycisphaerales bacterium]
MIIDLNTRVWSSPEQLGREVADSLLRYEADHGSRVDASLAALEREMHCVDTAFVMGFTSTRLGASVPDEWIAECCRRQPGRIGVAGIDPLADDAMDRLDRAADLGLQAINVSPACQGFHPAHSRAMLVYERALALSMPVFVTMPPPPSASTRLEFARPMLWDEVARGFPELKLVMGQLGRPWIDETLLLVAKHENVFAEISGVVSHSWNLYNALLAARSEGVMSKLFFGSGFPFESPARAIETLYSLGALTQGTTLPAVPRQLVNGIVERDVLGCLGLEGAASGMGAAIRPGTPRAGGRPMQTGRDSRTVTDA